MPPELYAFSKSFTRFFSRYHAVTIISLISLVLAIGIFLLYQVVQTTFVTPPATASTITDFNQKTIDKIKDLRDSNAGATKLQLPSPRSNPFAE